MYTELHVLLWLHWDTCRDRPIMLVFNLLCYAAVLIKFTYYAQNYAQEYHLKFVILYTIIV